MNTEEILWLLSRDVDYPGLFIVLGYCPFILAGSVIVWLCSVMFSTRNRSTAEHVCLFLFSVSTLIGLLGIAGSLVLMAAGGPIAHDSKLENAIVMECATNRAIVNEKTVSADGSYSLYTASIGVYEKVFFIKVNKYPNLNGRTRMCAKIGVSETSNLPEQVRIVLMDAINRYELYNNK